MNNTKLPKPDKYHVRDVNCAMRVIRRYIDAIRDNREEYSHEYKAALLQLERTIKTVQKFH